MVDGLTLSVPVGVTPVPETAMFTVGLVAFEVMVTLPLADPAEAGLKATLKLAL
jgi:hypothetical protein